MAKIITKKSQIPKYAAKKIKDFKNLTTNQAIYEYELIKLQRRAKGDFAQYAKGYYARPTRVTQKAIKQLQSLKGTKLKTEIETYKTELRVNRAIREEEKLDKSFNKYDEYDYTPSIEPDYSFDLNEEIQQEIEYPEERSEYWVDPNTGEAILWDDLLFADMKRAAIDFLQDLKEQVRQSADNASIAHSYYKNGRTVNAKQRRYYEDNITSAMNTVLNKIDSILTNDEKLNSFTSKYKDATLSWEQLVLAASEYIADSYKTKGGDPVQAARLNELLDTGPITMSEAMKFVDSAYDVDEYEE